MDAGSGVAESTVSISMARRRVAGALRHYGVRAEAIEDATQDVLEVAHRNARNGQFRLDPCWLRGVARRIAYRYRRTAARRSRRRDALQCAGDIFSPAIPQQRLDAAIDVARVLTELDDDVRVCWELWFEQGYSGPEIRELTGTLPNTLYSRLSTVRRKLRASVQPEAAVAN